MLTKLWRRQSLQTSLRRVEEEQLKGHIIGMVGDGTNDAPGLAKADVGLAMNSGTAAAKEAANMVDLDSDPSNILKVVKLGQAIAHDPWCHYYIQYR